MVLSTMAKRLLNSTQLISTQLNSECWSSLGVMDVKSALQATTEDSSCWSGWYGVQKHKPACLPSQLASRAM